MVENLYRSLHETMYNRDSYLHITSKSYCKSNSINLKTHVEGRKFKKTSIYGKQK